MEKSAELLALQKEADSMRADFSLLRNQFLTERKKAEKQVPRGVRPRLEGKPRTPLSSRVAQLCDPIDRSPPGSPVSEILQARTLEWVAISFSNA